MRCCPPSARNALLGHLPGAVVVDGYGTSETGGQGNHAAWPGQPDAPSRRSRFTVGEDTAVLDDAYVPVAPGSGRIGRLARTGHIPLGYRNDPDGTAQTFPVVDGVRWAIPGDLALVEADGSVTLLGRGSNSINSGGEKVFPDRGRGHPEGPSRRSSTPWSSGSTDERWGQRVAAVVQLRPGSDIGADDLTEHCRSRLAGFKVPRLIVLVDRVERRASGKPDHRWAQEALRAPPASTASRH